MRRYTFAIAAIYALSSIADAASWRLIAAARPDVEERNRQAVADGTVPITVAAGEWISLHTQIGENQQLIAFLSGPASLELADSGDLLRLRSGALTVISNVSAADSGVRAAIADAAGNDLATFVVPAGQVFLKAGSSAGFGHQATENWSPIEGAPAAAAGRFFTLTGPGAASETGDLSAFVAEHHLDASLVIAESARATVQRRRTMVQGRLVQGLIKWDETAQVTNVVTRLADNRELRVLGEASTVQVSAPGGAGEGGAGLGSQAGAFGSVRFPDAQSPAEIARQRATNDRTNRRVDFNFGGQGLGTGGFTILGVQPFNRAGNVIIGPGALGTPR